MALSASANECGNIMGNLGGRVSKRFRTCEEELGCARDLHGWQYFGQYFVAIHTVEKPLT